MRGPGIAAAAALAAVLALAGCGASDDTGGDAKRDLSAAAPERAGQGAGADEGYASSGERGGKGAPATSAPKKPALPQQHMIRTAELSVEVDNAAKALARARTATENAGGHVASETTERVDGTHVTSRVVLRVPQAGYDSVLKELAGTGTLLSRKADAKDVTEQVVDVQSRIATQRASVERVRKLMDQATQLSDVVTLESELSRRQADLESLLAQQASLKDRTTLATITLELSERGKTAPETEDEGPGFLDALSGGWNALVTVVTWIGIALAALAPWAAALLVLFAVWRWLVRPRLTRRRTAADSAPAPAPAAVPAPAHAPDLTHKED
ncbi:DUF4349 domain-containing protein [Streptomyces purpureus]|uniref:Lipoprotein n=1 Tax=Streptomyces purpureus TaxID=1951 RepID=A0A918GZ74_9ACTN|nr:DUF4349 domain-containing protein [Streptomyces purpureus]GGT18666.1 lipoprotein [Streptomyces purpureus]